MERKACLILMFVLESLYVELDYSLPKQRVIFILKETTILISISNEGLSILGLHSLLD